MHLEEEGSNFGLHYLLSDFAIFNERIGHKNVFQKKIPLFIILHIREFKLQ